MDAWYRCLNTDSIKFSNLQGDFFQVGESIKASNFSYDISGWTKISLKLQTTWHLLFKKEKIFLANFVNIFIKPKISGKSMFFYEIAYMDEAEITKF